MRSNPIIGHRISVIGTSGSGKTTTAQEIANRLQIPHIELDALHWGPNWAETPIDEFRTKVENSLKGTKWVINGNYGKVRDIVWSRADTIFWLDYSLPRIMWQLIKRTFRRVALKEKLWGGNRESLSTTLLSKDSILLWALTSYQRRKRQYPQLFEMKENSHLAVIRARNPKHTRQFLSRLGNDNKSI